MKIANLIPRMVAALKFHRSLLQTLAFLSFVSLTLADVTLEELQEIFHLQMDLDYGGSCDREYNGESMMPSVLKAFEDTWLLSSSAQETPPLQISARSHNEASLQAYTRLRELLFGFFGILLDAYGQFDDEDSHSAYNELLSKLSVHLSPDTFNMHTDPHEIEQVNSKGSMPSKSRAPTLLGTDHRNSGVWKTTLNTLSSWRILMG